MSVQPLTPAQIAEQTPTEGRHIRFCQKTYNQLPEAVAERLRWIREDYPSIKTFDISVKPQGYKVYAGEGYKFWFVYGGEELGSLEFASQDSLGALGVSHNLDDAIIPPAGTWVFQTTYYTRYWLNVTYISGPALPAPSETGMVVAAF